MRPMLVLPPARLALLLLLLGNNSAEPGAAATVTVTVRPDAAVATVDPREVSFAWDLARLHPKSFQRQGAPGNLNLKSVQVRRLMRELGPYVLRVSGTACDATQFGMDARRHVPMPAAVLGRLRAHIQHPTGVRATDWDVVGDFVGASGADLVLGLNQLTRHWPEQDGAHACAGTPSCQRRLTSLCRASIGRGCQRCIAQHLGELQAAGCQTAGVTEHNLMALHDFCHEAEVPKACAWNPSNAQQWLRYNMNHGLRVYGYELGK